MGVIDKIYRISKLILKFSQFLGWNGGGPNTGVLVRTAWLNFIDCNVFVVDWVKWKLFAMKWIVVSKISIQQGAGAQTPNYVAGKKPKSIQTVDDTERNLFD